MEKLNQFQHTYHAHGTHHTVQSQQAAKVIKAGMMVIYKQQGDAVMGMHASKHHALGLIMTQVLKHVTWQPVPCFSCQSWDVGQDCSHCCCRLYLSPHWCCHLCRHHSPQTPPHWLQPLLPARNSSASGFTCQPSYCLLFHRLLLLLLLLLLAASPSILLLLLP